MRELLARLKKADQETYKKINAAIIHASSYWWPDMIQGEIQRAIEAKPDGWTWNLFVQADKKYCGEISEIGPGYDGDYYNEQHLSCIASVEDQPSAAAAILSAYLQALEANR